MGLLNFWCLIVQVCVETGGSVTSWVRSDAHNREVGGVDGSRHLSGAAVDVVFDRPEGRVRAVERWQQAGLEVVLEESHVHVELSGSG